MMTLSDQSMLCTIFSSTHMSWISLYNTWTETVINTVRVCMYNMYVWHSLHANGIGNMPDNQYFGVPSCWHTKIGPYMTCHSHKWRVWTQTRSVRVQWLASLHPYYIVFCFVSFVFSCSLFVLQHGPLMQGIQTGQHQLRSVWGKQDGWLDITVCLLHIQYLVD